MGRAKLEGWLCVFRGSGGVVLGGLEPKGSRKGSEDKSIDLRLLAVQQGYKAKQPSFGLLLWFVIRCR